MLNNEWVKIPGGAFVYRVRHRIMEGDCQVDHGPVMLDMPAFEIQKYPVTNAMYRTFIDQTGYTPKDKANYLRHFDELDTPDPAAPVVWVSLTDAKAYADWVGGALPSDAQWQYAASGPSRTRWPWGDEHHADYMNADGDKLTPVDRYPKGASSWGLMDLCGNAWEWVDGPIDDGRHLFALIRGGCHYRARHFWHIAGGPHPTDSHEKVPMLSEALGRAATVGFRCVRKGASA